MSPERIVILATVAACVALAVLAVRAWNARRQAGFVGAEMWTTLGVEPDGRPTLVTFSTPSCAACHQAQKPAARAAAERVQARHLEVDAANQPNIARAFGVLTVPSTAVLSPAGKVAAVNQGFAPTAKLVEQILAA